MGEKEKGGTADNYYTDTREPGVRGRLEGATEREQEKGRYHLGAGQ